MALRRSSGNLSAAKTGERVCWGCATTNEMAAGGRELLCMAKGRFQRRV